MTTGTMLQQLARLTRQQRADVIASLPPAAMQLLNEELADAPAPRSSLPDTPTGAADMLMPGFKRRPHLDYIADTIGAAVADVEAGRDRRLIVELPPRVGKTTTTTQLTPAWIMARHPSWPIAITSHDRGLATSWGRQIRRWVEAGRLPGVQVAPDAGAVSEWETTAGGRLMSMSTRESFTGRGARVLIIDDPHKDFADAHSLTHRTNVWEWWTSVAFNRLEPPTLVIVVMCMTGDTPVLRPDGTETPLRDIRPGDEIATYENGHLTTAKVMNWASQGADDIFAIRMASGRTVRANARHPFLTINEEGNEEWVRTDRLVPGSKVLSAEVHGSVSHAQNMGATSPSPARGSAHPTTTRPGGRLVTGPQVSTVSHGELSDFGSVMGLSPSSSLRFWHSREDGARSVERSQTPEVAQRIGRGNSASITTTAPEPSEGSSATTATSSSRSTSRPSDSVQPPTTWSITPDTVASVTPAGHEEVFDLQVERTENFIANGLVSHNTRWHEDDLVGRLLSPDYAGDPADWTVVRLPAIADDPDDPLGRAEGEPLLSPLIDETPDDASDRMQQVRATVGDYVWAAMYQQRPSPSEGAIFKIDALKYWTTDPALADGDHTVLLGEDTLRAARWVDSWDLAFTGTTSSDYTVGQRWCAHGPDRYLIDQQRGQWDFTTQLARIRDWTGQGGPHGRLVHRRLVEKAANGAAILNTLDHEVPGMTPVVATKSKEVRYHSVTPEIESGHVYVPHPADAPWVRDLVAELRDAPNGRHDDQADALAQALQGLRDPQGGAIHSPNRATSGRGSSLTRRRLT